MIYFNYGRGPREGTLFFARNGAVPGRLGPGPPVHGVSGHRVTFGSRPDRELGLL